MKRNVSPRVTDAALWQPLGALGQCVKQPWGGQARASPPDALPDALSSFPRRSCHFSLLASVWMMCSCWPTHSVKRDRTKESLLR